MSTEATHGIAALTPRGGILHKWLRPWHEIRRHPREEGAVYCRTCFILDIHRRRKRVSR